MTATQNLPTVSPALEQGLQGTGYAAQEMAIVRQTLCPDATDGELVFFAKVCARKKLDPFSGQICLVKRKSKYGDKIAIQTTIDGLRLQAARSEECAGIDDAVYAYGPKDELQKRPLAARVTVYRFVKGQRVAFTATARWDEYYPGDAMGFQWNKMPHVMIGKCAEALAIRKAFPNETADLYTAEELQRPDDAVDVTPGAQKVGAEKMNALLSTAAPAPAAAPQTIEAEAKPAAAVPLEQRLEKMTSAFKSINVDMKAILDYVDKASPQNLDEKDLEILAVWYGELTKPQQ